MNILVGVRGRGDTADSYYRAVAPWSIIQYWVNHQVKVDPLSSSGVQWADVVICQRGVKAEEELLLRQAKAAGKPVIYDADDNLFDIPASAGDLYNRYFHWGSMQPREALRYHLRMLKLADMVTVPTKRLGEILCRKTGKDLNVKVLPNCILRGDWDWQIPMAASYADGDEDTVTVGWMGYVYHWDDWAMIRDGIEKAFHGANARLVILGFPEVVRMFSPELREKTRVESTVSFSNMETIRQLMSTFDIAVLPLAPSEFNEGKSPLKAFQFGAAEVPIIASPTVYGDLDPAWANDAPAQYLRICCGDWSQTLREWIDRGGKRDKGLAAMADAWRRRVYDNHCYESTIEIEGRHVPQAMLWLEACKELLRS